LGDCDGEGIVDDEHPDEEREHAGDGHRQCVYAEQRFEVAAASGGRFDGESRAQKRGERGLSLFEADAILETDIDSVEVAAAAEHRLGGVDIHDAKVAAEGLRHAAGFEDAAYGELLAALHGERVVGEVGDGLAVDVDVARGGAVQAAGQIEERGLSGARGPDDGHHLAACDFEIDGLERGDLAFAVVELGDAGK
jgi:hypothetical protein